MQVELHFLEELEAAANHLARESAEVKEDKQQQQQEEPKEVVKASETPSLKPKLGAHVVSVPAPQMGGVVDAHQESKQHLKPSIEEENASLRMKLVQQHFYSQQVMAGIQARHASLMHENHLLKMKLGEMHGKPSITPQVPQPHSMGKIASLSGISAEWVQKELKMVTEQVQMEQADALRRSWLPEALHPLPVQIIAAQRILSHITSQFFPRQQCQAFYGGEHIQSPQSPRLQAQSVQTGPTVRSLSL
jgi:hypothetical protein